MHRMPELSNAEWKALERIPGILQQFDLNYCSSRSGRRRGLPQHRPHSDIEGTAYGPKRSIIAATSMRRSRRRATICRIARGWTACGDDMRASIALGGRWWKRRSCWTASTRPSASTSVPRFPRACAVNLLKRPMCTEIPRLAGKLGEMPRDIHDKRVNEMKLLRYCPAGQKKRSMVDADGLDVGDSLATR